MKLTDESFDKKNIIFTKDKEHLLDLWNQKH